jgi:hypothetical protein
MGANAAADCSMSLTETTAIGRNRVETTRGRMWLLQVLQQTNRDAPTAVREAERADRLIEMRCDLRETGNREGTAAETRA